MTTVATSSKDGGTRDTSDTGFRSFKWTSGNLSKSGHRDIAAKWIASLPDFPVSHSPSPASAEAKPTNATCGPQRSNVFAWYDRGTCSWKTSAAWLPLDISTQSSPILHKAGMTVAGEYYPQPRWERRINATGCGYSGCIPTPEATNATAGNVQKEIYFTRAGNPRGLSKNGIDGSIGLARWAKLFPTPTQRDWKDGTAKSCENVPVNGLLGRAIHQWPTPSSNNGTGGATGLSGGSGNRKKFYKLLDEEEGKKMGCQSLNPNWVEWLMGVPIGFTDLKDLETPRYPSVPHSRFDYWRETMLAALEELSNGTC